MAAAAAEGTPDRVLTTLRTHSEARSAACEAASVCPESWRVAEVLMELLANAIEHGNLGFGHALKRSLLERGEWESELSRRQASRKHAGQVVRLTRAAEPQGWRFTVEDEGAGFDWAAWLDAVPDADAPCGRGILLAQRLGGVRLDYAGKGNRVSFFVPFR